ncbi:MAG: hypothetical protein FJY76_01280 [Candidatus Aenigmarchaeota archaeon]|nr:hypothetical protein [Candidatus Aenigmarchaeota archaeon]
MRRVEGMKFRMDTEGSHVDSYVEVENQAGARQKERITITGVKGVHSTTRIAQRMRDSRGMFIVSLKDVAKHEELRPCLERIKKDCSDHGYDMAMVDNEWVLMLPKDAGIELETD